MFFQLFKYKFINCIRSKENLFWTFGFPLILGTMFFIAFGSISEKTESFDIIPVAVVLESNESSDSTFLQIARNIDVNKQYASDNTIIKSTGKNKSDDALFDFTYTTDKDAKELLDDKKVDGILFVDDSLSVSFAQNGINQTVIKSFTDNYIQKQSTIENIVSSNPDNITKVLPLLTQGSKFNKNIKLTDGNMDPFLQYYYALIAMTCLFGCQYGFDSVLKLKANLSSLGARRCVAPTKKWISITADFLSMLLLHLCSILLLLLYMIKLLKIDFGNNIPYIILTIFAGALIGISYGQFIGSIKKLSRGAKEAILIGSSLSFCFFSGLMYSGMPLVIEHNFPLFNRINPANLITDALYSLNVYQSHTRFFTNIITMFFIAIILCVLSFVSSRRENYDSL